MKPLMRMTTVLAAALLYAFVTGEDTHARPPAPALTCGGLEVTIVGTNGDDEIDVTVGHDVIAGLS